MHYPWRQTSLNAQQKHPKDYLNQNAIPFSTSSSLRDSTDKNGPIPSVLVDYRDLLAHIEDVLHHGALPFISSCRGLDVITCMPGSVETTPQLSDDSDTHPASDSRRFSSYYHPQKCSLSMRSCFLAHFWYPAEFICGKCLGFRSVSGTSDDY